MKSIEKAKFAAQAAKKKSENKGDPWKKKADRFYTMIRLAQKSILPYQTADKSN